jgi:DNA-binding NarL/FixJ family response regulator
VVILDYNLADASSLALLADIESLPEPPQVLILSGDQEVADIAHAVEYGASGWVVKGGTVAELLEAVEQALDGDLVLPRGAVGELVRYLLDQLHRRGTSV